ncbi:unnamed protein product [Enterobius vermicularis]|uniref:VipB_2 domain-containing protein n=1 Tax=Enterobius vermicularis TaxID=51028 RepID=A0A0N4V9W8_ENTVE|nr:unnamed protein product [Enterobius vermicularis]
MLIIFTLPQLETNTGGPGKETLDQITVRIEHEAESAEFQVNVVKSVEFPKNDEKVKVEDWLQLRSLFTFAAEGDPLALLAPMAALLSATDNDGCK